MDKVIKNCRISPSKRSLSNRKYSLNEFFFDVIDTEEKAYWLGFITADGCISGEKGKSDSFVINLVGTKEIVSSFKEFLAKNQIKSKATVRPTKSIFSFTIGGISLPQKVARLIWRNSNISLDRKTKLIKELSQKAKKRNRFTDLTLEEFSLLHKQFKTWEKVAGEIGTSRSHLNWLRARLLEYQDVR